MILKEIAAAVAGNVVCGEEHLGDNVDYGFASDLMSDVLTLKISDFLLITGLANIQSVRTAEMSDVKYLLLVRDKQAPEEMLELAQDNGMVIITTPYSMFKTVGILYSMGLKPVY